jgi:monolysocardiolipin acyltransferase
VTQAVRLLSRGPFLRASDAPAEPAKPSKSLRSPDLSDPFTHGHLSFSTNGTDTFPAPAAYLSRRHSWIHIFPEGRIHQTEEKKLMRYFKWGVSRLILESEPCPDVVPIWLEGPDQVMHESREFPRFLPRPFKDVSVTFGAKLDGEQTFGDLRERWKRLRAKGDPGGDLEVGVLNDTLKYSDEAVALRTECTMRVRQAVLAVRRTRGLPDEDPKAGLAETYAIEGGKHEGRKDDGSIVKDG